ncbi:hypothetical protein N7452_004735 [Penicillium brevicompactum]|uniref:Uncharacterized protein n=1 Tax=Penicillium brevicompactum TaxID=5074 RepID=A0A9W9QHB2_PENBR|nr:hypothetical protein N7452_004735 [Penicillium brevicompactum]
MKSRAELEKDQSEVVRPKVLVSVLRFRSRHRAASGRMITSQKGGWQGWRTAVGGTTVRNGPVRQRGDRASTSKVIIGNHQSWQLVFGQVFGRLAADC